MVNHVYRWRVQGRDVNEESGPRIRTSPDATWRRGRNKIV